MTLLPTGLTPIAWSNAGGGTLDATSGGTVVLTSGETAGSPSVTATFLGTPINAAFTVVEPASESAVKTTAVTGFAEDTYPAGTQGAGMYIEVTVAPTDVSFENLQYLEVPGPASNVSGFIATYISSFPATDLSHHPNASWLSIQPGNKTYDHAAFSGFPSPWDAGGFEWNIPVQWRVGTSASVRTLPNRLQQFAITNTAGTSTVSKLGQTVTRSP